MTTSIHSSGPSKCGGGISFVRALPVRPHRKETDSVQFSHEVPDEAILPAFQPEVGRVGVST